MYNVFQFLAFIYFGMHKCFLWVISLFLFEFIGFSFFNPGKWVFGGYGDIPLLPPPVNL